MLSRYCHVLVTRRGDWHSTSHYSTRYIYSDCYVFTSRYLVTSPNNGDSSTLMLTSFPVGCHLTTDRIAALSCRLTGRVKSKSKLCYDRRSVGLGVKTPSGVQDQIFVTTRHFSCLLMQGALSDERTGLSFTIAAGHHQGSHSRVSRAGLMTIFYSLIRDSSILVSQVPVFISPKNREAQLYPPDTEFPFHSLLRLAGIRWTYSSLPPRGHGLTVRVIVRVTLRPAVYSQPIPLGAKPLAVPTRDFFATEPLRS
jgi:hypothetical protein